MAALQLYHVLILLQVIIAVNGWNTGWKEDMTTFITSTQRKAHGWNQRAFCRTTPSSTRTIFRWVTDRKSMEPGRCCLNCCHQGEKLNINSTGNLQAENWIMSLKSQREQNQCSSFVVKNLEGNKFWGRFKVNSWDLEICRNAVLDITLNGFYFRFSGRGFWSNHSLQSRAAVARQRDSHHQVASSLSWLPREKRPKGEDGVPEIQWGGCYKHTGNYSDIRSKSHLFIRHMLISI